MYVVFCLRQFLKQECVHVLLIKKCKIFTTDFYKTTQQNNCMYNFIFNVDGYEIFINYKTSVFKNINSVKILQEDTRTSDTKFF